jgi:hypothetical protein
MSDEFKSLVVPSVFDIVYTVEFLEDDIANPKLSVDFLDIDVVNPALKFNLSNADVAHIRVTKKIITPSIKEVSFKDYYHRQQLKIEKAGLQNWPMKNGKKLYGRAIASIPILPNGSIYIGEGGPTIEVSSGNQAIDTAVLKIIRKVSPFDVFSSEMRSSGNFDVLMIITAFDFIDLASPTNSEKIPASND